MNSAGAPVTVVLADDHQIVRQGVRLLIEAEPDLSVVGEASDGHEALRLVETLEPQVLVADLAMPGLGGLEITRRCARRAPRTRVIVLSMHTNEAYVREALRSGASGYVLKGSSGQDLVRAIRDVTAGRRYVSSPFSDRAMDNYARVAREPPEETGEALTPRELEVLGLVCEGLSSPKIARRLGISPRTADVHRSNLMRKLGVSNRAQLVQAALHLKLVPGP